MNSRIRTLTIALLTTAMLSAAGQALAQRGSAPGPVRFRLKSPVVNNNGGSLPVKYTCDGESVSPPLVWTNPPAGTQSYALTMHHIPPGDEAEHVYMVLFNIPPSVNSLPENVKDIGTWGAHTMRGLAAGYTPPCSGGGGAKIYTVTLYALSVPQLKIDAPNGLVTMQQLRDAIRGKVLDSTYLDVTYLRANSTEASSTGMGTGGGAGGTGARSGGAPAEGAARQGGRGMQAGTP
jgi:Raf kinase inhibitor-like YbhB/YbcL family protein